MDDQATTRGRVRTEPGAKRVRVFVGGIPIADTIHPLYVWENPSYPAYYFPIADVCTDLFEETATVTHSPSRGDAKHFSVRVGDVERVDAAWQYSDSPITALRDHVRFDWDAMDAWFEEDEEVHGHPKNPYHRVDVLESSRHVQVEVGGVVVADSRHPRLLFETGLPVRYYVPKVDVRMDLLEETDTQTHCPYKGHARYWSVRAGAGAETVAEDAAWSYPYPLPEAFKVADLVAFWKVDIIVDGERV
jgi:uncharacterized protein (DUF427 family)